MHNELGNSQKYDKDKIFVDDRVIYTLIFSVFSIYFSDLPGIKQK